MVPRSHQSLAWRESRKIQSVLKLLAFYVPGSTRTYCYHYSDQWLFTMDTVVNVSNNVIPFQWFSSHSCHVTVHSIQCFYTAQYPFSFCATASWESITKGIRPLMRQSSLDGPLSGSQTCRFGMDNGAEFFRLLSIHDWQSFFLDAPSCSHIPFYLKRHSAHKPLASLQKCMYLWNGRAQRSNHGSHCSSFFLQSK